MIAPDVIWLADVPLRGPDQVLTNWQKFFDAPQAPFSWARSWSRSRTAAGWR